MSENKKRKYVWISRERNYQKRKPGKRYVKQAIHTDGKTFLTVCYDDNDGGFEHAFGAGMTKELVKKLKEIK